MSRSDLVLEEFTEVLQIHLALRRVHDGRQTAQFQAFVAGGHDRRRDFRQLADAGGFDHDAVWRVFFQRHFQRDFEIARQAAADAAGVHLAHLYARVLQEAAVDADLAELVLDDHDLLARISFRDQFLDQCRFTCSEETGVDINFCHMIHLFF